MKFKILKGWRTFVTCDENLARVTNARQHQVSTGSTSGCGLIAHPS